MGMLSSFLHPEKGYEDAEKQLQQYYNQAQGYLNPIYNKGQTAYEPLYGAMQALLNPQALEDSWVSGYDESEAAKNAEQVASQRGLNAMSAQGVLSSTPALQSMQAGTSQIVAADEQQYLDDLMQKYLAGAALAQNLYGTGVNAAGQMGQNAMNMGQSSAQMAYGAQNSPGNLLASILGAGVGLAGSALGGSKWKFV